MKNYPLISVWMTTYFDVEYIEEALDSIKMQETSYPFEIVIGDDASSDGTYEKIMDYSASHPEMNIKCETNPKNIGLSANVLKTKMRCKGKYIINLSGDDYWICKDKIQMQADFLEEHPDYIAVGTEVEIRYGNSKFADACYPPKSYLGRDYTLQIYEKGIPLPSHGLMVRNIFTDPNKNDRIKQIYSVSNAVDDMFDPLLFLEFGKIHIINSATSVYRQMISKVAKHNFNSMYSPMKKAVILVTGYNGIHKIYGEKVDLKKLYVNCMNIAILSGLVTLHFGDIKHLYATLPERYRKPWKNSVLKECIKIVPVSAWHKLKRE